MFARVRRLDGNAVTRSHRPDNIKMLVIVAILPNSLRQEAWQLVVSPPIDRTDKPIGRYAWQFIFVFISLLKSIRAAL